MIEMRDQIHNVLIEIREKVSNEVSREVHTEAQRNVIGQILDELIEK